MDTLTVRNERELTWSGLPSASMPGTVRFLLEQRLGLLRAEHVLPAGMADDVYLAAHELVAAACAATPDTEVGFTAVFGARWIRLRMWDADPREPVTTPLSQWPAYAQVPDRHALDDDRIGLGIDGWRLSVVAELPGRRHIEWSPRGGKWVGIQFDF